MSQFSLKQVNNLGKFHQIPVENRKMVNKVILFTNARDEKNIKEWAAHHLLLGFDLIYIFDHKSQVPIGPQFANFDKRVFVERCEMNSPIKLPLMMRAAKAAQLLGADWMIYLDADEFIILNYFKTIKALLYEFHFADQLGVNWVYFGTNNHIKEPEGLILDNYTRSDGTLDQHVKSFVRPSQIVSATNPHFYNIRNKARNVTINKRFQPPGPFNHCNLEYSKVFAYIAHYVFQSEETYTRRKVNLPTDDVGIFRSKDPAIHQKHNSIENLLPKERYSLRVRKLLAQYDPNIKIDSSDSSEENVIELSE
jgi:hypothetical protein